MPATVTPITPRRASGPAPGFPPPGKRRFRDNPKLILAGIAMLVTALVAIVTVANRSARFSPDFLTEFVLYALSAADLTMLVALVFSCVFMAAVVWWGLPEVEDSFKYETRTESLHFPMWPFLAVLLFSFACMGITMLFQIYRAVQALRGRTVLHEHREEMDGTH